MDIQIKSLIVAPLDFVLAVVFDRVEGNHGVGNFAPDLEFFQTVGFHFERHVLKDGHFYIFALYDPHIAV